MSSSRSEPLTPVALSKDGPDRLVIEWNDGHRSVYTWQHLRTNCPCAGCREEREQAGRSVPHPQAQASCAAGAGRHADRSAVMRTRSSGATATTPAFTPWNTCDRSASVRNAQPSASAAASGDSTQLLAGSLGPMETFSCNPPEARSRRSLCPNIKNMIAVASGKGGVGKSTVAANLALALHQTRPRSRPARRRHLRPQRADHDGRP